jgi:outer membrane receptor protein involved in Fe transport
MRSTLLQLFTSRVKRCGLCLLVALLTASGVWAQTQITTGVIQGSVQDESGAVLPGATVEVKNKETNLTKTLVTEENGRFVFLQLPPGRYTLTVSKQGFATLAQEEFQLTVGQAISLDLTMKVSGVEERVTVSAIPTIDTLKTESSTTLNETAVNNLPVLGRKFEDLLTLTPGVSITQGPDGDEINFVGQRGIFNNISLDGGDYNNGFFGEQAGGQRAAIDITLEAVQEFQVVATGAPAEFGRTASGVVNVITKSGTNEVHGSAFYFQRLRALSSNTSDGKPLTGFHREQFGGTVGGPIKKDRTFFFLAFEQILDTITRDNLSAPLGTTPCPVLAPTVLANEALINSNPDCQRLALINFYSTSLSQQEGLPIKRPVRNSAFLGKFDWNITGDNKLSFSYNFDHSSNENQTFDVPTYGNSANGIEGPSKIHVLNFNLFSTLSQTKFNEAHFTYARETRPRSAVTSNVPADTGIGQFAPTFRFGNPFFLQPNVDELTWRTQVKDNFSIISGTHTIKFGGEWIHTLNDQVFRGFFTGRYLFDTVTGFLRFASPSAPGGFGPTTVACSNGTFVTPPETCVGGTPTGGPLLFYLQDGIPTGLLDVPPGASNITNQDYALFIQDSWRIRPNFTLNYGLRWDAQIFPDPVIDPAMTAYGPNLNDPNFPSDGTLPNQTKEFQPRFGFAWDISKKGKSVLRGSYGIYYARQNMLSQVGSITTNGAQQFSIFTNTTLSGLGFTPTPPVYPNSFPPPALSGIQPGSGVRVFSRDYENPRVNVANIAFEQEIFPDWAAYFDFTWSKGIHLTRFVNINNGGAPAICCAIANTVQFPIQGMPNTGDSVLYSGPKPFPNLGDVFVTSSSAKSLYRGFTAGVRKRFSRGFQLEANYVWSKDMDDDSNERDPFTDRAFNRFDFSRDYSFSDRDIRHRFNFYTSVELPWDLDVNARIQAHTAQPITPSPRVLNGVDRGRNSLRKNNGYFSFDWRLQRPFKFGERYELIPIVEMFNTFNNPNFVNPLVSPALFNFDGFLRQGVGDPRQLQLALKFKF